MYKIQIPTNERDKKRKEALIYCGIVTLSTLLVVMFFVTIYTGAQYLQDHIQEENEKSFIYRSIGQLPNTRNEIKKWSINHLSGVDITTLGLPPLTNKSAFSPHT
jgi:hypothetical protein